MMTVVESPNRKLRRELGLQPAATRRGLRVGDWLAFDCGDKVHRKDDPAHVGRVEAINSGIFVKVRWSNGWFEELNSDDLRRVK